MPRERTSNQQATVFSSFRDPSGFIFYRKGQLYRQINWCYKKDYDFFKSAGLYDRLTQSGLLIKHEEVKVEPAEAKTAYKIIKPQLLPFLSYPYEWCFSQLKDAALLTLNIQKIALQYGMSLKDASAYNVQFLEGRPVFIDTLSFEKYTEGKPWVAYRQFCQHFLAPLVLISYKDIRLNQLLRVYIDGIPIDLVSLLLPWKSRLNPSLFFHIHLHAKSQKRFGQNPPRLEKYRLSREVLLNILDNLIGLVTKTKWQMPSTQWANYYQDTNYSRNAFKDKKDIVARLINKIKPKTVWDLGANTGEFSRIATQSGAFVVAFDSDPGAVEINYKRCIEKKEQHHLPLILDLTNPSPGVGWSNEERLSIMQRGPVDLVMMLALVHHLAISNNLPFYKIAEFANQLCQTLIIEFVPKDDSNAQRLLEHRKDIFLDYNQKEFEKAFACFFPHFQSFRIKESKRSIYLFKKQGKNA